MTLLDQSAAASTVMPPSRSRRVRWPWLLLLLPVAALFSCLLAPVLFFFHRAEELSQPTPLRPYQPVSNAPTQAAAPTPVAAGPHIRVTWISNREGRMEGQAENLGDAPAGSLVLAVFGTRATSRSGFYTGQERAVLASWPLIGSNGHPPLLKGDKGWVALTGVGQFQLRGAKVFDCPKDPGLPPPGGDFPEGMFRPDFNGCTEVPLEQSIQPQ